ncbi:MAG: hypothetical protein KBH14_14340 [Vicinamibacteria bacterium]|jgi:hypothetical protein|nr:hypothetical protein [Vicinamibacteria bacterium]
MSKTRNLRLSTGFEVPIDGDLLAIVEALYKEITLGNVLNSSFETMRAEILALIDQMTPAERRDYLAESLFLNSVTYENEMLAAYVRRLSEAAAAPAGRKKTPTRKPSPKPAPRPGKAATPARPTLKARKATKKKAR